MPASQFEISEAPPTAKQFAQLRGLIGWTNPELDSLSKSIENSLYWVSVLNKGELIAVGRVVGDGHMYFYVQDVIVHPEFQGLGLGKATMVAIEGYLFHTCKTGATIGLFAASGKEAFYKKYGYIERNGQDLGLGMCKFI